MRKIAGAHVVFHKKVCILRKNKKCIKKIQAVLLCKRTQDAPTDPGRWSLIGGKLNNNKKKKETPEEGLLREADEELEVLCDEKQQKSLKMEELLQDMQKLCNVPLMESTSSIMYFSSQLDCDIHRLRLKWNKKERKVEGEGLGWFTEEEVQHLMMRLEERTAVTKFFRANRV